MPGQPDHVTRTVEAFGDTLVELSDDIAATGEDILGNLVYELTDALADQIRDPREVLTRLCATRFPGYLRSRIDQAVIDLSVILSPFNDVEDARETYAQHELDQDRNPTEDGFLEWLGRFC